MIDFISKRNIEIESSGREQYRIWAKLFVVGNVNKLSPFLILEGEPWKTIEKDLRSFVKDKSMYIYCQEDSWCNTYIFNEWIFF